MHPLRTALVLTAGEVRLTLEDAQANHARKSGLSAELVTWHVKPPLRNELRVFTRLRAVAH